MASRLSPNRAVTAEHSPRSDLLASVVTVYRQTQQRLMSLWWYAVGLV
ncbi:hypothetical protein Q31a_37480 [Aureliella helgolandensis]|uniref:Uncharacterized protein n=1 Tax=Aureliella helgolandensis TaxID=2527968 RepID=A0A518GA15_9BACT|nr:hypothetical protein Q31a_37480 [Aureliella helgolandensis]